MANLNNIFNPLFLKDKELKIAFELLFFTIKDFDRNISFLLKIPLAPGDAAVARWTVLKTQNTKRK